MKSSILVRAAVLILPAALASLGAGAGAQSSPATDQAGAKPAQSPPPAWTLDNGSIQVDVLEPATQTLGKDQRFDWSGRVVLVQAAGHTFFGSIKTGPDSRPVKSYSTGTSDEFKTALTMPAADSGPTTSASPVGTSGPARDIRIGIGLRQQRQELRGKSTRTVWELTKPFEWQVTTGTNFVEFRQDVTEGPWGYNYVKRVELAADAPAFTISRKLKNTGQSTIDTMSYCHNWLRIDGQYIAGQYRLTFPFEPRPAPNARQKDIDAFNKGLEGRTINPGGDFWAELGPQPRAEDNQVIVTNVKTGGTVKLTGDWAPDAFNLYVKPGECCPEPFIHLQLEPGQSRAWTSRYEFGSAPPASQP